MTIANQQEPKARKKGDDSVREGVRVKMLCCGEFFVKIVG